MHPHAAEERAERSEPSGSGGTRISACGTLIETVTGAAAVQALQPLWGELEARYGPAPLFQRFAVSSACAEAAEADGSVVLIAVLSRGGLAETLFPLRIARRLGPRIALPLAAPLGQYADVVGAPPTPTAFAALADLLAASHGVDLLHLRGVRVDGNLFAALPADAIVPDAAAAPFIELRRFANFGAYDASFSRQTRRNRRMRRQKLEAEAGPLSFMVVQGVGMRAILEQAIAWKRDWLDGAGLSGAVFETAAWRDALMKAAMSDDAFLSVLSADAQPLAVELGFADGYDYHAYLGAFDPAFARASIGQEQMLRTVEWCFRRGFERYDLSAPADAYKLGWTRTGTRTDMVDCIMPLTAIGQGYGLMHRHARPLARRMVMSLPPAVRRGARKGAKPAAIVTAALGAGALVAAME